MDGPGAELLGDRGRPAAAGLGAAAPGGRPHRPHRRAGRRGPGAGAAWPWAGAGALRHFTPAGGGGGELCTHPAQCRSSAAGPGAGLPAAGSLSAGVPPEDPRQRRGERVGEPGQEGRGSTGGRLCQRHFAEGGFPAGKLAGSDRGGCPVPHGGLLLPSFVVCPADGCSFGRRGDPRASGGRQYAAACDRPGQPASSDGRRADRSVGGGRDHGPASSLAARLHRF